MIVIVTHWRRECIYGSNVSTYLPLCHQVNAKTPNLHLHQSISHLNHSLNHQNPPSFDLKMSYLWGEHPSPSPSPVRPQSGAHVPHGSNSSWSVPRWGDSWRNNLLEWITWISYDRWIIVHDHGWSLKCKQRWDDESRLQDNEQEGVLVNVPHTPHTGTWVCERLVLTCGLANICWWGWLRQQNWSTIKIAIHLGPVAQSCLEPGAWKQLVEKSCSLNMPKPSRLCGRNVLGYIPTQCKRGADSPQTEVNPKPTAGCLSIQPVIDPIGSRHKGPWRLTRTALCFK